MRRVLIAMAALSMSFGAAVAPAAAAPSAAAGHFDPAPFLVEVKDLKIPGSAGVSLDALVYLPLGGAVHPLVVMPASWGAPKVEYESIGRSLAGKGYVAIAYTPRGFYSSTGTIMIAGAEDQADLSAVIDWGQTNTPANGKVGVFGVSYGAGIGLLGAQTDPRIKAVAALSGWTDLEDSMVSGNTVSSAAIGLLGDVGKLLGKPDQLLLTAVAAAEYGDIEAVTPIAETRSVGRHVAAVNANGAAILVGNGWQDSLFPADQFFDTWDKLTVPKRLMLAPGDHAVGEVGGIVGLDNDYVDAAKDWLDRYLLSVDNGADKLGEVRVKPSLGGAWASYPSLAALRSSTTRRYLAAPSASGALSASLTTAKPSAWSANFIGGKESSATIGLPLVVGASYALGLPPTSWMQLIDRSASMVWQTEPQRAALKLSGLPSVHATITPGSAEQTVIAYLYDVDVWGKGTLLSWEPWTAKGLKVGSPTKLDIRLQPVVHTVKAGHRVVVIVDSFEDRYRSETLAGEQITIGSTASDPAYVELGLG